jgi:nucleoside-diphosphate kinase
MNSIPMTEKTLVLLKPDAVRRGLTGEIISRFEKKGLKIVSMKMVMIQKDKADKHYEEHKGKDFFDEMIGFITSGPVVAMVIEGINSIKIVRKIVGSTNPEEAIPGTIRGDFAHNLPHGGKNLVHASANEEAAEREIELWFGPDDIVTYTRNDEYDVF